MGVRRHEMKAFAPMFVHSREVDERRQGGYGRVMIWRFVFIPQLCNFFSRRFFPFFPDIERSNTSSSTSTRRVPYLSYEVSYKYKLCKYIEVASFFSSSFSSASHSAAHVAARDGNRHNLCKARNRRFRHGCRLWVRA